MKALLLGFIRVLGFVAAWALIHIALLATLLPPFSTRTRLWGVLLPAFFVASLLINFSLHRQRKPGTSGIFIGMAACLLFLLTSLAIFKIGAFESIDKTARRIFELKRIPHIGLMAKPELRHRLFLTGAKLDILRAFPHTGRAVILDYKVQDYLFSNIQFLFNEIFINQVYFFPANSPQPFIIDCGSHIGMSILYAKTLYPDAQVIGFEPAPGNFDLLSKNIQRNGLKKVVLFNKAVGNKEGKMTFYGDNSLTASLLRDRNPGDAIEVEVVRLSGYINRPVSFLKLDIEGAETLVLEDLASASKLHMIQYMTIEYHHHTNQNVDNFSRFLKTLEDNNFGYQLEATPEPFNTRSYQDIMIYAYRK